MDNLISRQAAIDAAIEAVNDWDGVCNIGKQKRIEKYINMLPSVQSELPESCDKCEVRWKHGCDPKCKDDLFSRSEIRRWIPVSEKLPNEDGMYFITLDKDQFPSFVSTVTHAYWIDGKWHGSYVEKYDDRMPQLFVKPITTYTVLAWMPIPESYKEERREDG